MVDPEIVRGLIRTSTILSMIGAGLVAFTWAYPVENRKKHGRILLLWLSVADFLGSLFYFLQTFDFHEESSFCKACAALDIFFPVASFIWTDFIAYYLFLVVRKRADAYRYDWSRLLFFFHVIAWSVSLITMLLVIGFNHAGRDDTTSQDDDDGGAETAGWCWIKAHNSEERWIWELIGGKFIEWSSGLLIVPYLYISVAYQLYQIDRPQQDMPIEQNHFGNRIFGRKNGRQLQTPLLHPSQFNGSSNAAPSESNPEFNGTIYSENQELTGLPADMRVVSPAALAPEQTANANGSAYGDSQQSGQSLNDAAASYNGAQEQDLSYSHASSQYGAYIDEDDMEFSYSENMENPNKESTRASPATAAAAAQSRAYFSRFYLKLFVLPIVFILIRLWSSLRVILLAAGAEDASRNDFLLVMQAFFDPSQGFFNAVLFVFFSPEDRTRLWDTMTRFARHACVVCLGKERVERVVAQMPRLRFPNSMSTASLAAMESNPDDRVNSSSQRRDGSQQYGGYRSKMPSQDAIAMPMRSQTPKLSDTSSTSPNNNKTQHPLGERRLTTSSEVIDIEDDFECSDGDRFSNYSFDGRGDSSDASSSIVTDNVGGINLSPVQANQLLPPHIQALQQLHQLQTLQAYSATRSASRSLSQSLASSSPPPSSSLAYSSSSGAPSIRSQNSTPALPSQSVTATTGAASSPESTSATTSNPLHRIDEV